MQTHDSQESRHARLYRMVLPDHTCPFGVHAREQLEHAGYKVDEHLLTTREETDAFKNEHGVSTTPQVFIDGERIGGADELDVWLARNEGK